MFRYSVYAVITVYLVNLILFVPAWPCWRNRDRAWTGGKAGDGVEKGEEKKSKKKK
jgi:hypothetical protein